MSLDNEVREELRVLEADHMLRVPRVLEGRQGVHATVDGVDVVNFASNDYLGLAGDRRLSSAAAASLDRDGVGAGSSRLIIGNHRAHVMLEHDVADWMRCSGVRLFSTGYAANVGVLTTLLRAGDAVFSDELNHASIIDGCRLSRASVEVYPHRDLAALERGLQSLGGRRRLVVSESVFSMDGDVADVAALAELCRRYDAVFVLDEAHAVGVVGPEGRGAAAAVGVVPDLVIGTFGKALGTFGAFAATTQAVSDLLWNRARSLVFSTGVPPCISAATSAAVMIVRGKEGDDRRRQMAASSRMFRALVPNVGGAKESAIAPIVIGDDRRVVELGMELLAAKLLVASVRPPTVPAGTARLRVSMSAAHTAQNITELAAMMQRVIQ